MEKRCKNQLSKYINEDLHKGTFLVCKKNLKMITLSLNFFIYAL